MCDPGTHGNSHCCEFVDKPVPSVDIQVEERQVQAGKESYSCALRFKISQASILAAIWEYVSEQSSGQADCLDGGRDLRDPAAASGGGYTPGDVSCASCMGAKWHDDQSEDPTAKLQNRLSESTCPETSIPQLRKTIAEWISLVSI